MAYLGDIRETSIGPNGETWEAGGRVEQRYYHNGAFIDLCDLPKEDYVKTIFVTSGNGGGGNEGGGSKPSVPQLQGNTITVIDRVEGSNVFYQASSTYNPVDEPIKVTFQPEGFNEMVTLTIPLGRNYSDEVKKPLSIPDVKPIVQNMDYNPKKDSVYDYNILYNGKGYGIIGMVIEREKLGTLSNVMLEAVPDNQTDETGISIVNLLIPGQDIEYALVIGVEKEGADAGQVEISTEGVNEYVADPHFEKGLNTFTVHGKEYYVYTRVNQEGEMLLWGEPDNAIDMKVQVHLIRK